MKDFTGKVACITGGASGAGLGQAKVFSEAGMKVVIADIRQDQIDEALAYFKIQKNARVHTIKIDRCRTLKRCCAARWSVLPIMLPRTV
jgi:NAD(P)-dependent dehydrogenase (short-subunit alcohol dehydrogenase family)